MATKRRGPNEGSIFQRKSDGRWTGTLNLGWDGGKRKRKTLYGPTYEAVRADLNALVSQRDRGVTIATDRLTLAQFTGRWLTEVVDGRVSPRTLETYQRIARLHITPTLGPRQLSKLTAVDVNGMLRDRERAGLSPRMVKQILVVLRMILKQAVQWDLISRNPASLVSVPPGRPFVATALDDAQIARFLAAAEGQRLEALFSIAVLVGPRLGELQGLHWRDVNLATGEVHIRTALVRVHGRYAFADPKTAGSTRTITLPERCREALQRHRRAQLAERLRAGSRWRDLGLVFTSSIGTPVDHRALTRQFRAVLATASLPRIRFHDLRHSAITAMVTHGVPPHIVARIVGHTDLSMTLRVYAKVTGPGLRDAAAVMDHAFGPARDTDHAAS